MDCSTENIIELMDLEPSGKPRPRQTHQNRRYGLSPQRLVTWSIIIAVGVLGLTVLGVSVAMFFMLFSK